MARVLSVTSVRISLQKSNPRTILVETDPDTGEPLFLQLDNGQMFVAYDRATGGAMCEGMPRYLTGSPT